MGAGHQHNTAREDAGEAQGRPMAALPRLVGLFVIGAVIVGFVAILAFGLANRSPVTGRSGITRVGKPAPQFTLPLFSGEDLEFTRSSGRPAVINFWASWCPPCRQESPLLERTWRQFEDEGILFIGIDIQDTEEEARAYLNEFDITFPNGIDAAGEITIDYGVIGLPVTFFIGSDGIVQRRWVGAITESQLLPWVEELVADRPPSGETEGQNLEGFRQFN